MKINRTFLALIFVVLILFAASIYSAQTAEQIRKDEERTGNIRFHFSDGDVDRNYADYIAIGLFIVATSTIVAAIWIKKSDI